MSLRNRHGHKLEQAKSTIIAHLLVLTWWFPELFASLISIALFYCTIVILLIHDGVLLTELRLPNSLTLNGVVAALATANRACLSTPVCSGLLQQMWIYLAEESTVKGAPGVRLRDLELYTEASTGAWGSLLFIPKVRSAR